MFVILHTNINIGTVRPDVNGVLLDGQFVYVLLLGQVARPDDQLEVVVPFVSPLQPVARLLLKFAPEMDKRCKCVKL